jgi:hypothetical protein
MKKLCTVLFLALAAAGCDTAVTKQEIASVDYGPAPERWKEEIQSYLRIRLTDPKDAIVEFRTEPKQLFQRKTAVRDQQWGWAVCVWVNDKNKSGAYDGFYPMSFFLRNDKIVAVNNGPDDFGVIGAQYAREQCSQLGAPFIQMR